MAVTSPGPKLDHVLYGAHFAAVREPVSALLDYPDWFVAWPATSEDEAAPPESKTGRVSTLEGRPLDEAIAQDARHVAERARRLRSPIVLSLADGKLIGGVPLHYKQSYLGVVGVANIEAANEPRLRSVLLLLRENLTLFLDLLTQFDDLELVHQIWRQLNASLQCADLLPDVLRETLTALSLEYGVALLVDEDGSFVPHASSGLDHCPLSLPLEEINRFDYEERIPQWRSPVVALPREDALSVWMRSQVEQGTSEQPDNLLVVAVPLIHDAALIGMILGTSRVALHLSQDNVQMLRILVEGAAASVANALLFDAVREKKDALFAVHGVHRLMETAENVPDLVARIARQAMHLFKVPKCIIMLRQDKRNELLPYAAEGTAPDEVGHRVVPFGEGLAGWIAENYTALKLSSPASDAEFAGLSTTEYPDTHYLGVPMIERGLEGVILLSRNDRPFTAGERETLAILAEQSIIAINNARMIAQQQQMTFNVLRAVARVTDSIDSHRQGHSEKVSVLADKLVSQLGVKDRTRRQLRLAALLHDISYLDKRESELQSKLSGVALSLIESMELDAEVSEMIRHFREDWDGSGRPDGLAGEEIPLGSRVIAVANAMMRYLEGDDDAAPLSTEEALGRIRAESGTRYDPAVVQALATVTEGSGRTPLA